MNPGRRLLLAATAGAAMAAGAGVAWWRADAGARSAPASFWALSLERPEGGPLRLADYRGKPLLINFWASWCAPCVRELPEIDRFARERAGRLAVLALAIDGPTPVREFLQRMPLGVPVGLCGMEGSELMQQFGNDRGALPFTVLLAADGSVRERKLGETNRAELERWTR